MKVIKTANGKTIKLNKSEWEAIGKKAGWMKTANDDAELLEYDIEVEAEYWAKRVSKNPAAREKIPEVLKRNETFNSIFSDELENYK